MTSLQKSGPAEAGDFIYRPGSNAIGLVVPSDSRKLIHEIAFGCEVRHLLNHAMILPYHGGDIVVRRNSIIKFRDAFVAEVLKLPRLTTDTNLQRGVLRILCADANINARDYFDEDEALRDIFGLVAEEFTRFNYPDDYRKACIAVAFSAIFSKVHPFR